MMVVFRLLSLSNAGIGNFGMVALMSGYGASFSSANIALTAFLGFGAIGVLAGGFLADRTQRHGQVAAACFSINAAIVFVIATISYAVFFFKKKKKTRRCLGDAVVPSAREGVPQTAASTPGGAAVMCLI